MANDIQGLFSIVRGDPIVEKDGTATTRFANVISLLVDASNNQSTIVEEIVTTVQTEVTTGVTALQSIGDARITENTAIAQEAVQIAQKNGAYLCEIRELLESNTQLSIKCSKLEAQISEMMKKIEDLEQINVC